MITLLLLCALQEPTTQDLIRDLGAEAIDVREKAQKALAAKGDAIVADLRKALENCSAEAKGRIAALIQLIQGLDIARTRVALEYYALWNGGMPARLDDLVTKPAGATVWPDGGFLDRVPKLEYGEGKLVGKDLVRRDPEAPGPAEIATTRLRLAQAVAVVRAFRAANSKWPASLAEVGGPTRDGWGNDLRYTTSEAAARIASPGRNLAGGAAATDEQKKKAAQLVAQLTADWIQDRDAAAKELDAMGAIIVPQLEEALRAATENGAKMRLEKLLQARRDEERDAFQGIDYSVFTFASAPGNGKAAATSLKTLATAEADFRSNDRDNDRTQNFWVGDVHSLHWHCPSEDGARTCQQPNANLRIGLIEPSIADADAAPLNLGDLGRKPPAFPTPKQGYLFRAVRQYRTDKLVSYSSGKEFTMIHKNFGKFAFIAYPADYGVSGTKTFLMDENLTIWAKDTGGDPFLVTPQNPAAEGWQKGD